MLKTSMLLLAVLFCSVSNGSDAAGLPTLRVDLDPTAKGAFRTIQSAIDTIPVDNKERITIEIADGSYSEKIRIDQNSITLRGESREGVKIAFWAPRSEYDRRYDEAGPAVVNVFGNDVIIENLTIENTQTSREHAFALYGQPDRFILRDCDVLSEGGDTASLWNTAFGRYYHTGCRFRGGVDFVCPRGWCYVSDCDFECPTRSAAIWHDGHMDLDMKFVLRDCRFDGVEDFWLGRNHYPSQFYLIDCEFSENLADRPIETVKDLSSVEDKAVYERKYFYNCRRDGGDFAWHQDNLDSAKGSPEPAEITAAWTFAGDWDPESTDPPHIETIETLGDQIHVYFSEPVGGGIRSEVQRADDTIAKYQAGTGTQHLVYAGGTAQSLPQTLLSDGEASLYGLVATLKTRSVPTQELPRPKPRTELVVLLIGDSTVADYSIDHAYQGWGHFLQHVFDDRINVVNRARGGRSSKSYRDEGHWDEALKSDPDFVFLQFGHNDNPGKGPERETNPAVGGDYRDNLRRYVADARAAGAKPVLVTPTTRRLYNDRGEISDTEGNNPYAEAVLAVAEELGIPSIDLNRKTRELFERSGEASSDWMQPDGDRTHFTPAGARRVAAAVAGELSRSCPDLARFLVPDATRPRR